MASSSMVFGGKLMAVSAAALLAAQAAAGAPLDGPSTPREGVALLVTASAYDGDPRDAHAGCRASAQLITDRLRRENYDVVDAADLSRSATATAIDTFSDKIHATPRARTFVYVCGYAASARQRIFFLPAPRTANGTVRLETDGMLVKDLLDAVANTDGAIVADFDAPPGHALREADIADLRRAAAPSLRLDVRGDRPVGAGGRDFALEGGTQYGSPDYTRAMALLRQGMTDALTKSTATKSAPTSAAPATTPLAASDPPAGVSGPAPQVVTTASLAPAPQADPAQAAPPEPRPVVQSPEPRVPTPQAALASPVKAATVAKPSRVAKSAGGSKAGRAAAAYRPMRLAVHPTRPQRLTIRYASYRHKLAAQQERPPANILELLFGPPPADPKTRRLAAMSSRRR